MICPYCQHELDVATLSCLRCGAEYPRAGRPFGYSIRTAIASGAMLLVFTLILTQCVLVYLPGGKYSDLPSGASAQLPIQPLPGLKSPEVMRALARWSSGKQADGPTPPGYAKSRP